MSGPRALPPHPPRRRRSRGASLVAAGLLLLLLVELLVLIAVGRWIGVWPTLLLLLVETALGAWLVRREGSRAWRALRSAVDTGLMPGRQLADGIIVLLGGLLVLLPGFVTDVVGILLLLPITRPVARRLLERLLGAGFLTSVVRVRPPTGGAAPTRPTDDGVIDGEIVDDN